MTDGNSKTTPDLDEPLPPDLEVNAVKLYQFVRSTTKSPKEAVLLLTITLALFFGTHTTRPLTADIFASMTRAIESIARKVSAMRLG